MEAAGANCVNQLGCVMGARCVVGDVGTDSLNNRWMKLLLESVMTGD